MDSDEALLERLRTGDIGAFDALYDRHEVRLFAYLRALCTDKHDAEELLHDAFLEALKTKATFDDGGFRAWLYRVARNLAFNRRRSHVRREKNLGALPLTVDDSIDGSRAEAAIERRELEAALADAVRRLPRSLEELYHLRTSGLSYEQIADVVHAPLGTVKSRMHQMVNQLREELKPWILPT